ncbi:hypothetical protein LTR66_006752 [Elasticomyces elasticus]|nr:hypothetical protein LTR66_006752 [Elasticomyces elasticus]KAK5011184.1 hypothetical protein LTR28_005052 [Elasticomyces elasticus]
MSGASPDSTQGSPSSTLPDVATWGFDPEGTKGDFARLIPMSPLARTAFNEVVRKLCDRPDALRHAQRFIHFEPVDAPDNEESGDETPRETTVQRWCGCYRLNMGILPNNPNLGWVVGSSRPNLRENDADLLLTAEPVQHHVRGRHARFTHNRETGVLLVSADTWTILVNGTIELCNTAFAICEKTGLMFGDLNYTIELTDLDPETYQRQLREVYPQGRQPGPVLPNFSTPTPTPSLRTSAVNKYYIAPPRTGGVSSTVSHAFVMSTGASVAMKRMKRGSNNFASIKKDVELLQSVNHRNICRLVEPLGYERLTGFRHGECDEVTLVLTPFAPPLSLHIRHQQPASWITSVFRRCFAGLDHLHQRGIMHRDIKLDNIGLASVQPPRVVLLDFGHATRAETSTNHMRGTVRYLAPEVLALKEHPGAPAYTNLVDTWALGICLFEMFRESFIPWSAVSDSHYQDLRTELRSEVRRPTNRYEDATAAETLIWTMLRSIMWDPLQRDPARYGLLALGGEDHEGVPMGRNPVTGMKKRQDD